MNSQDNASCKLALSLNLWDEASCKLVLSLNSWDEASCKVPDSILSPYIVFGASQVAPVVESLPPTQETQETWVQFLGREDPLE